MSSSSAQVLPTGTEDERQLRPRLRPRKPQHSQLSQLSADSGDGDALTPMSDGMPLDSGQSTPIPDNAPPSVKSLSDARKQARAESRRLDGSRRRIFPTVEFASRVSHFDPESDYRDFHGFFNLFWIGLAIMGSTAMLRNMKDTGYPFRFQIWNLFAVKLWHLAIADFLMVASTMVSLPLHRRWRAAKPDSLWTWKNGGMAVQSIYQTLWLCVWIAVPFAFEWAWTAQVFLLLHTMVLLMKMHSWAFYNGHLSETEKRLRRLDAPSSSVDRAPAYLYPPAGEHEDAVTDEPEADGEESASRPKSPVAARGVVRRRSSRHAAVVKAREKKALQGGHDNDQSSSGDELEYLREDLAGELTSPMGNITYPSNLTWSNYFDYLLCPTLCYEIEYPRTKSINWTSLISKIVATFGCIFLLTQISEEFILPVLADASRRLLLSTSTSDSLLILAETISWLLFPFMLTFLLVFLVIFEYVLGAFAEITRFGDRHFYSDWWNSTDWMEFSREWNVPVYSFLRRHVYSASRPHIGKVKATLITFLISAIGHEIVMACITKKLRGYGFICQMLQLPIVMLQRTRWVRNKQTLNNVCFWFSMIIGLSMICALYVLV